MITCKIYNQNGFQKQSNTLLDSGAQISLVHKETVVALALKGNNTTVTLTKVGVEEGTIKTKVYKVPAFSFYLSFYLPTFSSPISSQEHCS